jgi:hypothetical protein
MVIAGVGLLACASGLPAVASPGQDLTRAAASTVRASVQTGGGEANASSGSSKVSANCRVVTFASAASNLVAGDTKRHVDAFAHDLTSGRTFLVSRALNGERADGDSRPNGLTASGRFIAYYSSASNLVRGDSKEAYDVFVRARTKARSERISVPAEGGWADRESFRPAISAKGRYVAFDSYATNMVPDDLNGGFDVFVRDRVEKTTERVSVDSSGGEADGESTGAAISSNGRFVVFESGADNLDPADTNDFVDVFVHDRKTGTTELVSAGVGGVAADDLSVNSDISGDGRYIAFTSKATNLVDDDANGSIADVFVRDRVADTTQIVSVSSDGLQSVSQESLQGTLSDDGSVVTFDSFSSRLVPHDTNRDPDVFVHFMESGATRRVSVSTTGHQGNLGGLASAIAGGGGCVSFTTGSTNLVPHDTNAAADVLLRRFAS